MKCDGRVCKLKELYSTEEQKKKWVEECEATAEQCPLFTAKLEQKSEHRPMVIEDKYFGLLGTYIYDKRTKMNGILSDLCVMGLPNGYMVYYNAYMNSIRNNAMIFVEDFESGNVVFLEPFGIVYMEKEMKEIAKRHRKAIVDFFGDKFRESMIVRISESERQKKIKEWEMFTYALKEWGTTEIRKQIPMEHHHTKIFEISGKARESICPSCLGSIVTHEKEYPEFCVWCGQKIDW